MATKPKPPPYPKPPRPPAEPPRPQPGVLSTTIRQIEFELYKAEHGLAMPYDAERVARLRNMLRRARKWKLSSRLAAKRGQPSEER
jgi:hypothetical protein